MHRLQVLMHCVVAIGFSAVLAGCGINGSVENADSLSSGIACEGAVQWPEWPGALPSTLLPAERAHFERAWSLGPNFACEALLVTRGCGTGCVTGLIHDAGTQRTQTLPFAIHREPGQEQPALAYSADSAVIIATGWRNEVEKGVFLYRWDGNQLHRIED